MILLQQLGRRILELRGKGGWTRQQLAARTGLSSRFLAEVESGRGNISLVRLKALADGLHVSLAELVASLPVAKRENGPGETSRYLETFNLLSSLSDEQLQEARLWMKQRLKHRTKTVALIGLRGAGKTTVGRKLASKLRRPFIELDEEVEKAAGLTLQNIFEVHGEEYYRRLEHGVLREILSRQPECVIACGGGIVTREDTFALLRINCEIVWLKARPQDHWNRVLHQDPRPITNYPNAFAQLQSILQQRESLYAQAHHVIDTSHLRPARSVEAILKKLQSQSSKPRRMKHKQAAV